jgi:hypothetical protein
MLILVTDFKFTLPRTAFSAIFGCASYVLSLQEIPYVVFVSASGMILSMCPIFGVWPCLDTTRRSQGLTLLGHFGFNLFVRGCAPSDFAVYYALGLYFIFYFVALVCTPRVPQ